jgi:hypothetical protein
MKQLRELQREEDQKGGRPWACQRGKGCEVDQKDERRQEEQRRWEWVQLA